jgi:hypothetical protein
MLHGALGWHARKECGATEQAPPSMKKAHPWLSMAPGGLPAVVIEQSHAC